MLMMAAVEFGSPVVLIIGVKGNDLAFHPVTLNRDLDRRVSTRGILSRLSASIRPKR